VESEALVLAALGLIAFFVRGVAGAGSAIVFNALFAIVIAAGLAGGLSLLNGLYWMALADALASVVLVALLARSIRFDRLTLLILAGLLPSTVVFALLLPHVELRGLQLVLGAGVAFGGLQLLRGDLRVLAPPIRRDLVLAAPIGAMAGIFGGLFGMAGPVLLLALGRMAVEPSEFRVRFTAIFGIANLVRLATLAGQGVYGEPGLRQFVITIPAVLLGLGVGFAVHRYVSARMFRGLLGVLVSVAGIVTVAQAI